MAWKILLADDSVTAQNMGRKILAEAGYEVVTVNNGSAALKRIAEIRPDLIVLDVYMPGYGGLEVCQRLKDSEETAHIPVLLTVGKLEPFKPEEARRVGAVNHIVKPFEASELLTAITHLEDCIVTQQSGGIFNSSVSGLERFGFEGGSRKSESDPAVDTGWKSRLGFPSKKKKEEKEEPEEAAAGTFRDFRKGKKKNGANAETQAPANESRLLQDLPRDITPEELDALSVLAAQLDRPASPAQEAASTDKITEAPAHDTPRQVAHETDLETTAGPVEPPAQPLAEAKPAVEFQVAAPQESEQEKVQEPQPEPQEGHREVEAPSRVAELAAPAPAAPMRAEPVVEAAIAEIPALAVEANAEVEIPVEHGEPNPEEAAPVAASAPVEIPVEHPVAVDERAAKTEADGPPENQTSETLAASSPATVDTVEVAEQPVCVDQDDEPRVASAATASAVEQAVEAPAPSDAELVQALRLLTPASWVADAATAPSQEAMQATAVLLAKDHGSAAGLRWIAEPVALNPEEAAISLEAEMFRTFAAMPAVMQATARGDAMAPVISGASAAAIASAETSAVAEPVAAIDTGSNTEPPRPEMEAEKAAAEQMEAGEIEAGKTEARKIEAAEVDTEKIESEQNSSPEESDEGEAATATFADAFAQGEAETTPQQDGVSVSGTGATVASTAGLEENRDSNSESGGRGSMGKNVRSKAEKSEGRHVSPAPASPAAPSDAVEAAKPSQPATEAAPKAMAAAAAAEGSASTVTAAPAADASTIASIVESVLADLRPKLVEEIARKLAGK